MAPKRSRNFFLRRAQVCLVLTVACIVALGAMNLSGNVGVIVTGAGGGFAVGTFINFLEYYKLR